MQLKINENVAALGAASNRMISVEDLSEGELQELLKRYVAMAAQYKATGTLSIDAEPSRQAAS
jgi:low affinity Fe/Cu permease